MEVRWLCIKCHFTWHEYNRPIPLTTNFPSLSRKEICSLGGKTSAAKLTSEQRKDRTRHALKARYRKEVTNEELRAEVETATNVDLLTAGVP